MLNENYQEHFLADKAYAFGLSKRKIDQNMQEQALHFAHLLVCYFMYV